jgi:hypothetical protein
MRSISSEIAQRKVLLEKTTLGLVAIIMLIGCTYIFVLTTALGPLNGFWSSDQGVKLLQVQSLLLNKYHTNATVYPGEVYDPQRAFSPLHGQYLERDGQSYAMFSAAFALVTSVPFFLLGYPGLYIIPIISTLLTLLVCAQIGKQFLSPAWLGFAIIICGIASPLFFYSLVFWEHTLATLLVMLGLWQTTIALKRQRLYRMAVVGICLGLSAWLRNEALLSVVALGLALLIVRPQGLWRACWWLGFGAGIGLLPLLIFNQIVYGAFVGPHILVAGRANYQTTSTFGSLITGRLDWVSYLLTPFKLFPLTGMSVLIISVLVSRMTQQLKVTRVALIVSTTVMVILGIFVLTQIAPVSEQTTLLYVFPLLLLFFLPSKNSGDVQPLGMPSSLAVTFSTKQLVGILFWFVLLFTMLAWLLQIPDGGSQWGPRMLLLVMPVAVLVSLWKVTTWFHSAPPRPVLLALMLAIIVLVSASLISEIYGIQTLRTVNLDNYRIVSHVDQSGQQVIITDIWYAPPLLSPIFYDNRKIFLISTGAEFDALLTKLAQNGITSFYYLGARSKEISATSRLWPQLTPIRKSERFAHYLLGTPYAMKP